MATTAQHKTALGRLIAWLGNTISNLFNAAKKAFNSLPPDQQKAVINGSQISQILKTSFAKGEAFVVAEISRVTGLPSDVVTQAILSIAKDDRFDTISVQAYLNHLADKVQAGVTDNKWNAIWQDLAKFAATYLTQGRLDWVSLCLGVVEYAFQLLVKV